MKKFIYIITILIIYACSSNVSGEPTYFYIEAVNKYFAVQDNTLFISDYIENLPNSINLPHWCGSSYSWSDPKLSASISIPFSKHYIVYLRDPHNIVKCRSYQDFVVRLPNLFPEPKDSTVDINLPLIIKDSTVSYCIGGKQFKTRTIPTPALEDAAPRICIHEEIPDCLFQMDGCRDSLSIEISGTDKRLVQFGDDYIICHPNYIHDAFTIYKEYTVFYVNKDHPNILFCDGNKYDSYCDSTIIVLIPLNKIFHKEGSYKVNEDWIQYCP